MRNRVSITCENRLGEGNGCCRRGTHANNFLFPGFFPLRDPQRIRKNHEVQEIYRCGSLERLQHCPCSCAPLHSNLIRMVFVLMKLYGKNMAKTELNRNEREGKECLRNGSVIEREKETLKRDIYLISIYIGRHFMDIGSSMVIVQHDDR